MTTSIATTEFDAREALRQHFEKNALTAFVNCIEFLRQRDFYFHALHKIEKGEDLTEELPELKLVKKSAAMKICRQLAAAAERGVTSVWELPQNIRKQLKTNVRIKNDEQSLLPVFDIEYHAITETGLVKINVKTIRRNISVSIDGLHSSCELLHSKVVMQSLIDEIN
jgi:hypothetical protein